MNKIRIVLDTSIFVNPDARHFFGKTPKDAFTNFLGLIKEHKSLECFMPPSIFEELMKFIEGPISVEQTIGLTQKPPSSYEEKVPALFVYEFIEEMRNRINKGLRISEKYCRKALHSETDDRKEETDIIKRLREEFRVALREGVLDSKEDFDLLLLAKELKAAIATADNGLKDWAAKVGIRVLSAEELKEVIL